MKICVLNKVLPDLYHIILNISVFFQLSLIQLDGTSSSGREEPRAELRKFCQPNQMEFWSCVNRTLEGKPRLNCSLSLIYVYSN